MKRAVLTLLFLFFGEGCIRFKYDNLSAGLIAKIPIGKDLNTIQAIPLNNLMTNIHVSAEVSSEYIFVQDFYNSMVKVFDYSGNLEKIIGTPPQTPVEADVIKAKFGSIGLVLAGDNDDVYIENRNIEKGNTEEKKTDPYASFSGNFTPASIPRSNSVIMHIDLDGGVKELIGLEGRDSPPFQFIEKMYLLEDKGLAVLHIFEDKLTLSVFKNGKLVKSFGEDTIQPFVGNETGMEALLDVIIPHQSGEYSLFSYRYFDKSSKRFKFRRIFSYNHATSESVILKEIQDPSEILFAVRENSDFYIWETESDSTSIRLQVHDKTGYHYNNKRILLDPPRAQWRETYPDSDDNLYSLRVRSGFLEVNRWN